MCVCVSIHIANMCNCVCMYVCVTVSIFSIMFVSTSPWGLLSIQLTLTTRLDPVCMLNLKIPPDGFT